MITLCRLTVRRLTVEMMDFPLGIGVRKPRLGWQLESTRRGDYQTAYRIIVASTSDRLAAEFGDLWDTGMVESDLSVHVPYAGIPLASGQKALWKVRVWDRDGNSSSWSESSGWTMGLLESTDWQADWIGLRSGLEGAFTETLDGASWIWSPAKATESDVLDEGKFLYFRFVFFLDDRGSAEQGYFLVSVSHLYEIYVNGVLLGKPTINNYLFLFDMSSHLRDGENVMAIKAERGSGPSGLCGKIIIRGHEEGILCLPSGADWKTSLTGGDGWAAPGFDDSAWLSAAAIMLYGDGPWESHFRLPSLPYNIRRKPAPYLRKQFHLRGEVRRAAIYATALGVYNVHLNGIQASADRLNPGWTEYGKRLQSQSFEVADLLSEGENVIGVILGDGWYAGHVGVYGPGQYGVDPRLLLQLHIEYSDGTIELIRSDRSWKASFGPILYADLMMGTTYDARLEADGWNQKGFEDAEWQSVDEFAAYTGELSAQIGPAVRVMEERSAISITESTPGTYLVDMGQNMVGWIRSRLTAPRGSTVTFRYSEMVQPDGTAYYENLRNAAQTDVYVAKGGEMESFEPPFTFHGFRYVEITGLTQKPEIHDLYGCVAHSDTPPTGGFITSDERVNQLYRNIVWGQKGNFLSVPTDCPQRDERMGWLGDAQIFARTASFNMNVSGFFAKWMRDVRDAQLPDGRFSDIAPYLGWLGAGSPAWADAGIIVPWTMYLAYGDRQSIEDNYGSMMAWIDYLDRTYPNRLRGDEGYGDWLSIEEHTPRDVIGTAYFAYSASLLAAMARITDRLSDAERLERLYIEVKAAFQSAYVDADGRIKGDTQTGYVLALRMNLLDQRMKPLAVRHLVRNLERRGWHLSTGFLGVGYLLPILSENGNHDTAYRILLQRTFPSWLYSVDRGATTVWERWDGWTEEKGFQDIYMNSFNHYSLGSVGEWMFRYAAGLDTDFNKPGYKCVILRPRPGGGLRYARAMLDSPYGCLVCGWLMEEDGSLSITAEIPPNASGHLHMPLRYEDTLLLDGEPVGGDVMPPGVEGLSRGPEEAAVSIGSGKYEFKIIRQ